MPLNFLSPIIYTRDIKGSIDFYVTVLGFIYTDSLIEPGWARVKKDNVEIMLSLPNEHISFDKPLFTGSFYINTTGVDALWETLKDKVQVCYEPENFEYGMREFAVYDNNGYLIQFGENIEETS